MPAKKKSATPEAVPDTSVAPEVQPSAPSAPEVQPTPTPEAKPQAPGRWQATFRDRYDRVEVILYADSANEANARAGAYRTLGFNTGSPLIEPVPET